MHRQQHRGQLLARGCPKQSALNCPAVETGPDIMDTLEMLCQETFEIEFVRAARSHATCSDSIAAALHNAHAAVASDAMWDVLCAKQASIQGMLVRAQEEMCK